MSVGLFLQRTWPQRLSIAMLLATVLVMAAFGDHLAPGGAYDLRAVMAKNMRVVVWGGMVVVMFHEPDGLGIALWNPSSLTKNITKGKVNMKEVIQKMRDIRFSGIAIVMGLVVASGWATAEDVNPVSPELTPKLQELLRKEMLSIEDASHQIMSYLVAGDDARVGEVAQQIHDSFIMQQSMTPQDKQDLLATVPDDFVARDRAFHGISAKLASAARDGDRKGQQKEFGRMIEACTACHSIYATDRFPKLLE